MIERLEKVNVDELTDSFHKIESKMKWGTVGNNKRRRPDILLAGVQHSPSTKMSEWFSVFYSTKKEDKVNQLISIYSDSPFEYLINKYNLTRSRFAWLAPGSCYSFHTDPSPRIHVPLITNDCSFFTFKQGDQLISEYLEPGYVYKVDTTILHSFTNAHLTEERLHFFGVSAK